MERILVFSIVFLFSCSETVSYGRNLGKGPLNENIPIGGFGSQNVTLSPWWLGPNVCIERREEIVDWKFPPESPETYTFVKYNQNIWRKQKFRNWKFPSYSHEKEETLGLCEPINRYTLPIVVYNCIEKHDKHICSLTKDYKGQNRTEIITQKCCHGYRRSTASGKANIQTPCEKIHLYSMIDVIAGQLNGSYFIRIAQKHNITNELKANVTLFMPNDDVFFDSIVKINSKNAIKPMILNHIVNGVISVEDAKNDELLSTKLNNNKIRLNKFTRRQVPNKDSSSSTSQENHLNLLTANCVPIRKSNENIEEGFVHIVDRILPSITKSLMELIREREDMTFLRMILDRTDFAEHLENVNKSFTIFAPTDQAFEKLNSSIRQILMKGNACALNILKNHLLDMTFCSAAIFKGAGNAVVNQMGEELEIKNYFLKPHRFSLSQANQLSDVNNLIIKKSITINDLSNITETDIMATNGVMHVIDNVLLTNVSSFSKKFYFESHNATLFSKLLKLNGIDEMVESFENVVIFVPTDTALQTSEWAKKIHNESKSLEGNAELTHFIQNHIAKASNKTCELSSGHSLETKAGDLIHVNFYPTSKNFKGITINCARLIQPNGNSCGSIMYQIDQPIEMRNKTIFELLQNNQQYSIFFELLKTANLTSLLKHNDLRLTVLVPKNEVFTEIKEYLKELTTKGNENELQNILKMYIVHGEYCCVAFREPDWISYNVIETIANRPLDVRFHQRPWIKNAGIITCDILATNGIIHEISEILTYDKIKPTVAARRRIDNSQLFKHKAHKYSK